MARAAIVAEAPQSLGVRCLCPTCLALDMTFPEAGYQLALFPYRMDGPALMADPDFRHLPRHFVKGPR